MRAGAAPTLHPDGTLRVSGTTSPVGLTSRQGVPLGPTKVIPVIFVPGIMGTNLVTVPKDPGEQPEIAWRPPNGTVAGLDEAKKWGKRGPKIRQYLLDPDTTAVDDSGPIEVGSKAEQLLFRQRGWGSIYYTPYGEFLYLLHNHLNRSFEPSLFSKAWKPQSHWVDVMKADRGAWGAADMPALTEAELKKFAYHQFPVYAVGYNWLQSNAKSAELLARKIDGWIAEWKKAGYTCDKVILVSHSMGGLVCRAYAKQHPDKVLGIVHGVQPAVGAPLCYRRLACGTEQSAPGKGFIDTFAMEKFAAIAGRTPAETVPVMGVSPGALELLPCHLHPPGWLQVNVTSRKYLMPKTVLSLPEKDPYAEIYRETHAWFRLIDPALLDPGKKYESYAGGPMQKFLDAAKAAERFHKQLIGNYYHPNTYAFYGHDESQRS
jgi:pimeloyl-ACP methyl ester carboxylesterase